MIELKRPTVHIGMDQIMQVVKYIDAVTRDGRFAMTATQWDFWIVAG